mgnify:CR=1 FL=1
MNKANLTALLKAVKAMIMRERVAYRDYLGEETVEETRELVSGKFGKNVESSVTFAEGETYLVNLDGVEQEMAAQDVSLLFIVMGS